MTPDEHFNLPNKSYWFAPERRDATLAYLSDRMYSAGAAMLALLAGIMQQVYTANIDGSLRLGSDAISFLALYFLYTGIWIWGLTRRFALPR